MNRAPKLLHLARLNGKALIAIAVWIAGAAPAMAAPETPHAHEIAVAGLVQSIDASGDSFSLQVLWVTLPGQSPSRLSPARIKRIRIGDDTAVRLPAAMDGLHASIQPGAPALAVGPDTGMGQGLTARLVIAWPPGTLGSDGVTLRAPGNTLHTWSLATGAPAAIPELPAPARADGEVGAADAVARHAPAPPTPLDHLYDYDYSAVDAWVEHTPGSAESSIPTLAAYLAQGAHNERERARVIFDWVATRIAYDYDGVASGRCVRDAEGTFNARRSDCGGHARLFQALARSAGLESAAIGGVSRAPWTDPVFKIRPGRLYPSHAWNAVLIDGQWRLLDTTFDDTWEVKRGRLHPLHDFHPEWFLTPPDEFAYTHIPDDARWQLLATSRPPSAVATMPYLQPEYFQYGLQGEIPAVISCSDHVDFTMTTPADVMLLGRLSPFGGEALPNNYSFFQREGTEGHLYLLIPRPGAYRIGIFARRRDDAGFHDLVAEFRLDATGGSTDRFPVIYKPFDDGGATLESPWPRAESAGAAIRFQLKVPGALRIGVRTGGRLIPLEKDGETWSGSAVLSPGDVQVMAIFPDQPGAWSSLLGYEAR